MNNIQLEVFNFNEEPIKKVVWWKNPIDFWKDKKDRWMTNIANKLLVQAMKEKSFFQIKSVNKDKIIENFKFDEIYTKTVENKFIIFMHMVIAASIIAAYWGG